MGMDKNDMMMKDGEMSFEWMDWVDRDQFICATIIVGFVAMALAVAPTVLWWVHIKPSAEMAGISMSTAPNYWNGWYAMWIGNLIAFAPASVMWIPSYFSDVAAEWYGYTWAWAEKAGGTIGLITFVTFFIEAITTGLEKTATKPIWLSIWLYSVFSITAGAMLMKFGEKAHVWYAWPMLEMMRDAEEMEENDGDANELDDNATELYVNWF